MCSCTRVSSWNEDHHGHGHGPGHGHGHGHLFQCRTVYEYRSEEAEDTDCTTSYKQEIITIAIHLPCARETEKPMVNKLPSK